MEITTPIPNSTPPSSTPRERTPAEIETLLANDPLLSAIGIGKELWADEHADEYVARLREGW